MTNAFGAIDLFAGNNSPFGGINLFKVSHNPLDTLSTDYASLASIGATIESAVKDIFANMPEILREIADFILTIPLDFIESLLGQALGSGSNLFGVFGELFAIPLDFIDAILAVFGLGPIGSGSGAGPFGTEVIDAILALFGLDVTGRGPIGGLGATLGADIANILALPIDFIDGILNLFGLPDLGVGFHIGTPGSNAAITLIETFLGGLGLGDITDLISFLATIESKASSAFNDILGLLAGTGFGNIGDLVNWLTTTVYGAAQAAIADIEAFLSGTGFSGDVAGLVALINGLSGDVTNVVSDLATLFGLTGTTATTLAGLINALAPGVEASLEALFALLGLPGLSGFVSFLTNIFPGFLPLIPASHVTNINPQLLLNPGFDSSSAITAGVGFTWDGTVGHIAVGSAKATADGAKLWMLSNPIAVALSDQLLMSIWVQWSALVSSGNSPLPISLQAAPYFTTVQFTLSASSAGHGALTATVKQKCRSGAALAGHGALSALAEAQTPATHVYYRFANLRGRANITAPASAIQFTLTPALPARGVLAATVAVEYETATANPVGVPTVLQGVSSPATNSGWTQLSGTYTVPSGVDTVYLEPVVDATATSGTVWFDDASAQKAGGVAGGNRLVDTFETLFNNLFGSNNLLTELIQAAVPALDSLWGKTIHGGLISGITTIEQNILDAIANALGHGGIGFLVTDIETFLGAIPGLNVLGLTGGNTVVQDLQAIADAIYQAIHGGTSTGNLISTIKTVLGIIPGANVLGITGTVAADLQSIADGIYQAIHGGTSTGNLISTIKTQLGIIPGANILGITGGATLSQDLQSIADGVFQAVHGGTTTGNLISTIKTALGVIPQANISGLGSALAALLSTTSFNSLLTALFGSNIIGSITTNEQAIADAIYQAIHGGTGTGNLISTIKTQLGIIPGANVLGITSGKTVANDLQSIADAISQAVLGGTTTGNLISTIKTVLGEIPGANILGITGGATLSQDLQSIADGIYQAVHGGTSTGNLISTIKTALGIIPQANVTGLGAALAALLSTTSFNTLLTALYGSNIVGTITTNEQSIADAVYQAIHGGTSTGNLISTIKTALGIIPGANVLGITGTVAQDLQSIADGIYQAVHGGTSTGNLISTIETALGIIPPANVTSGLGLSNLLADLQSLLPAGLFNSLLGNLYAPKGLNGRGLLSARVTSPTGKIIVPTSSPTSLLPGILSGITSGKTVAQDLQAIADGIYQAIHGGTSTGNLISTIQTALGVIPGANVLGITGTVAADLQSIADGIYQAIHGGTSTGNLISTIKTQLGIIPGANVLGITGGATVSQDLQSIADGIYQAIHGGTGTGNLISTIKTQLGIIPGANVLGITGGATLSQDLQSIADGVYQAIHGGTSTGNLISTIKTALGIIPAANVLGITGGATLSQDLQAVADGIFQAIHGGTSTGNLISTIKTALGIIPPANVTSGLGLTNLLADLGSLLPSATYQGLLGNLYAPKGLNGRGLLSARVTSPTGKIIVPTSSPTSLLPGILSGITSGKTVAQDLQSIADGIYQAIHGGTSTGNLISTIQTALGVIPGANVLGITGGATVSQDLQSIADGIYQAVHGGTSTGNLISTIKTQLGIIPGANILGITGGQTMSQDLQSVADGIYQAIHGGTSTGNLISTIKTELGIIPGANVLGITGTVSQDLQSIADGIFQAIHGGTSTGNLISTIKTALGIIPLANVAGFLSAELGASFPKTFPFVFGSATSGTLAGLVSVSQFQQLLDGLAGNGQQGNTVLAAVGGFQAALDTARSDISQAILDGTSGANTNTGIAQVLQAFPAVNITNVLGGNSLAADISAVATTLFGTPTTAPQILSTAVNDVLGNGNLGADLQSLLGGVGTGTTVTGTASISSVQQALLSLSNFLGFNTVSAPPASSVSGITQTNNVFIANSAINRASYIGVDPTGDPTFNFDRLSGGSLPTITLLQTATVIGMIGTPTAGVKESVAWLSCGYTGAVTNFYVNIYSVNTSTGALTLVFQSADLQAGGTPIPASSTPAWYYYDFPTPDFITAAQGHWYAVELQIIGSGTYTLAGITHQAPANGNVFPSQIGATRNPIATAAYGTTGTGNSSGSGSVASLTTTHTPGATDNGVVCYVAISAFNSTASAPASVTYAGNVMTLTTSEVAELASVGTIYAYTYSVPVGTVLPQSANSVVATFGGGTNPKVAIINCDSFSGVGSFAALAVADGQSTSFTQTVASATGDVVSQAFMGVVGAAHTTISAYNKTQTYNAGVSDSTVVGNTLTMGYTAGAASLTFTATANSSTNYGGVAVNIIPGYSPTAPGTVSSPTGSTNYPFLELCGSAGTTMYPPTLTTFTSSGTYTIPVWATAVDIVAFGGGGGGAVFGGYGGGAGSWAGYTLTGAPLVAAGSTIAVTVGGGGNGGTSPTAGGTSEVNITGLGNEAIAGGGGGAGNTGSSNGAGAGTQTFNGELYYGGAATGSYANTPGGGGAMAPAYPPINYPGAAGAVFFLAYQV